MKEISKSDIIHLQTDNSKYHWIKDALQFYYENGVR